MIPKNLKDNFKVHIPWGIHELPHNCNHIRKVKLSAGKVYKFANYFLIESELLSGFLYEAVRLELTSKGVAATKIACFMEKIHCILPLRK